jgi:WD40 repeat protein
MNRLIRPILVVIASLATATPALAADAPGSKPRPKVWAVVVGVDQYEDGLIPPCVGSGRDARAVAEWFEGASGWGRKHVLRMDDLGRKRHGPADEPNAYLRPTLENLDWAVDSWLGQRVEKDDIVLIYFAGQAFAKGPKPGVPAGRVYLLPIDARGADVPSTGWSLDDALDRAKKLAERRARVVIWLDTSPLGRGKSGLPAEKGAPSGEDWLRALTRWPGVTAWLAADGRRAPDPGAFVAPLLKALGAPERAHNLPGTLRGVLGDPTLAKQGFRTMGGVGPGVSLWSGGALVVEEAEPELIAQAGHGDRVTSVLVSADNRLAITASRDSTVRVWGLADRSLVRVLSDPLVGVEALALDRDGTVLMAGDGVGRLIGWDMTFDRPKPFYGPTEHAKGIVDLAFLPEGKLFVSRDRSRRAILWDASGGALRKVRDLVDRPLDLLATAARPDPAAPALVAAVVTGTKGAGSLFGFDAAGKRLEAKYPAPDGRITALDLTDDGRRLVAGDIDGRVLVLDLPAGSIAWRGQFEGPIRLAKFSKAGPLLVADSKNLRLVEALPGRPTLALVDPKGAPIPGEVDRATFSPDGRWLAVCTSDIEGRPLLWRLTPPDLAVPVALPSGESDAGLAPAFTADGRALLVGDASGGVRIWGLDEVGGGPKATLRPSIMPARGKVATLAPSASGRYLLEITKQDDVALVWDFEEGRGCKPLPGSWVAGAFLPNESRLALLRRADEGGDVVLFDRSKGEVLPIRFEHPPNAAFGRLAVSKSGKWVAAATLESQRPLACVWQVADGKLVHVARDHDDGLTGVDFSRDEKFLLTASADGSAKLWPMADPDLELHREVVAFRNPSADSPAITSASVYPVDPARVVTGTRGGHLFYWRWAGGKRTMVPLVKLDGEVNASAFSADGKWLAASWSLGKSIRFWSIPEAGDPKPVTFRPMPHHGEQVGALASWPGGPMMVSGGDDAAVKFWDLDKQALVGTLLAQGRDDKLVDWLAYTPEGMFDGSLPGEAMVKWRVGERIVTLEQSEDAHHAFQLASGFAKGVRPPGPKLAAEGPRLKIDGPPPDLASASREVELTVWSGDADPAALRLYQDGVPVRGEGDFRPGRSANFRTTTVSLRRGENRFYAMASKPDAIDGRSDDLTLRYDGPEPAGRVHVLALGISNYKNRPLKYAHLDARNVADFLQSRGVKGLDRPGERIVLDDGNVTPAGVDDAFRQLRDAVKGRPEDTVVLFLAGHTDTDLDANQFCLLLPDFPFEPAPPTAPGLDVKLAARGVDNPGVQARGNVGGGFRAKVGDSRVLPYATLYNRMARLEALRRMVIIDACQAGAILEDSAVRSLQRVVERGSRKARNSYLLAARRGEPANEADALEHGLLTYTLLRGMGAPGLKTIPADLGGFPGRPSADLNHDGLVTSDELVAYADDALPRLARMFPLLVTRAGGEPPKPGPAGSPDLEQRMKLQSADASFPLIAVPR